MNSEFPIDGIRIRHQTVDGDGVRLHVAIAGSGPPVVLLHGFPETWRSWRHQVAPLVTAGFSLWMPDLRGYGLSGRPSSRAAYHLRHLVADVAAVVEATGAPRAVIGGHDWGGLIAWTVAARHPAVVDRLVIFNAPHPGIFIRRAWRPPQLFRSMYVPFFLLPLLPELALSARRYRLLRRVFRQMPARPHTFSEQEIDHYVATFATPGALTAALNYYRANAGFNGIPTAARRPIAKPTLVLWGERDPALGLELLTGLERVVPQLRIVRFPRVGHWVHREEPAAVNQELARFLPNPADDCVQSPVAPPGSVGA